MAGVIVRVKVDNSQLEQIAVRAPAVDGIIGMLAASQVESAAKRLAPVDTGYLKSLITKAGSGSTWFAESGANYAGYQEWGTRYQKGTPHMRPALQMIDWDEIIATALRWLGL